MQVIHTSADSFKVGVVVTKTFGSAPKRNQFRRRVKAIIREWMNENPEPIHLVVRAKSKSNEAKFQELRAELISLLEGIK